MRRLLFIIGLLLPLGLAQAGLPIFSVLAGGKLIATTASPTLLYDSISATGEAQWDFGKDTTDFYATQYNFTPTVNTTITKFIFSFETHGDTSASFFIIKVWTQTGANNDLNTLVGKSDVIAGGINLARSNKTFDCQTGIGATIAVTAGTNYTISVSHCDATGANVAADSSNWGTVWYMNDGTTGPMPGQMSYASTAGVNHYNGTFTNYNLQFQIWGTTP